MNTNITLNMTLTTVEETVGSQTMSNWGRCGATVAIMYETLFKRY